MNELTLLNDLFDDFEDDGYTLPSFNFKKASGVFFFIYLVLMKAHSLKFANAQYKKFKNIQSRLTGQETGSSYLSSTACLTWADLFMSYN